MHDSHEKLVIFSCKPQDSHTLLVEELFFDFPFLWMYSPDLASSLEEIDMWLVNAGHL